MSVQVAVGLIDSDEGCGAEIPASLRVKPGYRDDLLVLTGDLGCAEQLASFGLCVHRVFEDAPAAIHRDTAHKMKHWMCLWALRQFGEFLWVDWDTVLLRLPDEAFWAYCRSSGTPEFIRIPRYWATVNCGVYYASDAWLPEMERSLDADVSVPNDELLWKTVLPENVNERNDFWWGERVVHVWNEENFSSVTNQSYFAHVKHLDWADRLRAIHESW